MISFEPLLDLSVWMALAIASALVWAWYAWRRPASVPKRAWRGLVTAMVLGTVLVLVVLLNPTLVEPVPGPPGLPRLTILVDSSASMATPDADQGKTRYRGAAHWGETVAAAARGKFEVRTLAFDQTAKAVDPKDLPDRVPDGAVTDLRGALRDAIIEQRPQGQMVLLLSDGIHNAGDAAGVLQAARDAKALASPITTKTFGSAVEARDLAVEMRTPQEFAFVGQKLTVSAWLRHRGLDGETAKLRLTRDKNVVDERDVLLHRAEGEEVKFEIKHDEVGLYRYDLSSPPLPKEMSLANNAASLLVQVVDRPVRILLLEGKPYWDSKFLVRTLTADPSVELDCLVRVGEGRLHHRAVRRPAAGEKAGPADEKWNVLSDFGKFLALEQGLKSYQVIVLGRDAEVFLEEPALKDLRDWLARDGGALVCFRGQPVVQVNQKLGQLLPLRWTPVRETRLTWNLTDRGKDLGWLVGPESLGALPSLSATAKPEQPRPLAVVLATAKSPGEASQNPAVAYQPYGMGRVVAIEGSGMWRWAFLPPQQREHDRVYGLLWHNLVRWLVSNAVLLPGQTMALRSDQMIYAPSDAIALTLVTRLAPGAPSPPEIELKGDALTESRRVAPVPQAGEPGNFRVALGKLPEGRYQANVVGQPGAETLFDVRAFSQETLNLKARPDLMAAIALASGGSVVDAAEPGGVAVTLHEQFERQRPRHVRRLSIWDRWWVMAGIVGIWVGAWVARRRFNLI